MNAWIEIIENLIKLNQTMFKNTLNVHSQYKSKTATF